MQPAKKTVLYDRHVRLGAQMVEFGGWSMPLQYPSGILREHLATRKYAGVFDVSHMGRFGILGKGALAFLQYVLSNDAAALRVGNGQYTILPTGRGGALDDAYLYRFTEDEYLLVVNAANRETDWEYLHSLLPIFDHVALVDQTLMLSMLSLQGPLSEEILAQRIASEDLPVPRRNALRIAIVAGMPVYIARTGYTGEPIGFELFAAHEMISTLWDELLELGAQPVGLGARDTLRLEAGLPLYGHELGLDSASREIPILAARSSRCAVSFAPAKGEFVGKPSLIQQFEALQRIRSGDDAQQAHLPTWILPAVVTDKGIARAGDRVFSGQHEVGYVTSGTMVPYWKTSGDKEALTLTEETGKRAIGLALVNSDLREGGEITFDIRGKYVRGKIVPAHLQSRIPPYARAIVEE